MPKHYIEPHSDASNRILGSEEAGAYYQYEMDFEEFEVPMNPGPELIDQSDVREEPSRAEVKHLTRT